MLTGGDDSGPASALCSQGFFLAWRALQDGDWDKRSPAFQPSRDREGVVQTPVHPPRAASQVHGTSTLKMFIHLSLR
jgi:hypothetical protein